MNSAKWQPWYWLIMWKPQQYFPSSLPYSVVSFQWEFETKRAGQKWHHLCKYQDAMSQSPLLKPLLVVLWLQNCKEQILSVDRFTLLELLSTRNWKKKNLLNWKSMNFLKKFQCNLEIFISAYLQDLHIYFSAIPGLSVPGFFIFHFIFHFILCSDTAYMVGFN